MIKQKFPLKQAEVSSHNKHLTYEETDAIRYVAGYIPRALRKELLKSTHPLKKELMLCLLNDGDEEHNDSCQWIDAVDRGGLTDVNRGTYNCFVCLELELRKYVASAGVPNFKDVAEALNSNDDVQFYWGTSCC